MLVEWGYEVVVTTNGREAWQALERENAPPLALLDCAMPELDGAELCRRLRETSDSQLPYIILLTPREGKENIVAGLQAGVDDYMTKPFDPEELRARVQVGVRVVSLQSALTDRFTELEDALRRIKRLHGLLPICASCKKIRDDKGYWNQLEVYIRDHSEAEFSNSICPGCVRELYPDQYSKVYSDGDETGDSRDHEYDAAARS